LLGFGVNKAHTQTNGSLRKITHSLGQGVNISLLEQHWNSPSQLLKTNILPILKSIAETGFETVRLPVAFDHFMKEESIQLNEEIIEKLQINENDKKLNHDNDARLRSLNTKLCSLTGKWLSSSIIYLPSARYLRTRTMLANNSATKIKPPMSTGSTIRAASTVASKNAIAAKTAQGIALILSNIINSKTV
jgi:hypothetical protein